MKFCACATVMIFSGLSALCHDRARAADVYVADPVHSSVVFRVKHANTTYFWGRFNHIEGKFTLDSIDPGAVNLEFEVKTASVDTANADRDKHLKGPDCFNAVQFPTIRFKSKSAVTKGSGYEVQGDLSLHGVTKPVSVHLTPTGTGKGPTGKEIGGIEATFSIKQSDFGMTKMAPLIGDIVFVSVCVEGIRQ